MLPFAVLVFVLAFAPAFISFQPAQKLAIPAWSQTYRTTFSGLWAGSTLNRDLVFQCGKVLCRCVYTFDPNAANVDRSGFELDLFYRKGRDQLQVMYGETLVYARTNNRELCAISPHQDTGCVDP